MKRMMLVFSDSQTSVITWQQKRVLRKKYVLLFAKAISIFLVCEQIYGSPMLVWYTEKGNDLQQNFIGIFKLLLSLASCSVILEYSCFTDKINILW